jgi:hypothetical protein
MPAVTSRQIQAKFEQDPKMRDHMRRYQAFVLPVILLFGVGCVERTMKITTRPAGAIVYVNDEEVGRTPVKISFTWYGDYDLVFRKPGYETLKTHYRLDAPWYQWPFFDLISETMVATTIRDERHLPTFELHPAEVPAPDAVVQRAEDLRDQALYGQ